MQKKYQSLKISVATAAILLIMSIAAHADSPTSSVELQSKNISADLAMLAMQAQNEGWKIISTTKDNHIEMKKMLTDSRMLTGVHTRWNRVTDTLDATAIVTLSDGKMLIKSTTEIKNPRHQKQFEDAIASLQKGWEKSIPMGDVH